MAVGPAAEEADMVSEFTRRVRAVVRQIPFGKVATYGMVAILAGSPRAARQVGWILHSTATAERLPWHRVVNRHGRVSLRHGEEAHWQRLLLEEEGVVFDDNGRIDLSRHLWQVPGEGGTGPAEWRG